MVVDAPLSEVQLHLVDDVDAATQCIRWLGERREGAIAFDSETGGFSFKNDDFRLVQLGDKMHGWAIPWEQWGGVAIEALQKYTGRIVTHNRPFDVNFWREKTRGIPGIKPWPWQRTDDTMLMAHCLDPVRSKALKSLTSSLVDRTAAAGQDALKRFMDSSGYTWATIPWDNQYYWGYGAMDTVLTSRLDSVLRPQVEASCLNVYEMELAAQRVCANMTFRGTQVDLEYCESTAKVLRDWAHQCRKWCTEEFGIKNPTSNMQAIKFFESQGFVIDKKTERGQTALDKEVLLEIGHPLAAAILKIRKAEKLCSTYLENFSAFADDDALIHPTIWTCGTRTARMSMSDPNFQNLPKNDKTIRNGIVADLLGRRRLLTCDADQIELRLMAHFAQDYGLVAAFNETAAAAAAGETDPVLTDFFCRVASEMLAETIGKDDPRRKTTKNSWYARLYGASARKIALTAGVPVWKIEEINAITDETYPGIRRFMKEIEHEVVQRERDEGQGYVLSHLGRRLPVEKGKGYTGTNYKIQSTAAEVFKKALIALDAAGFGDDMLVPVHDEVVLSVAQEDVQEAAHEVSRVMTESSAGEFILPITWSADILPGAWGGRELAMAA